VCGTNILCCNCAANPSLLQYFFFEYDQQSQIDSNLIELSFVLDSEKSISYHLHLSRLNKLKVIELLSYMIIQKRITC
jgi:hypothetical protein